MGWREREREGEREKICCGDRGLEGRVDQKFQSEEEMEGERERERLQRQHQGHWMCEDREREIGDFHFFLFFFVALIWLLPVAASAQLLQDGKSHIFILLLLSSM